MMPWSIQRDVKIINVQKTRDILRQYLNEVEAKVC